MMKKEIYWTKESIKDMVVKFDRVVERAMVALFKCQTEDEQVDDVTRHKNFKGFTTKEAKYGHYLARWVRDGKHLTDAHLKRARGIAKRHISQLTKIANGEIFISG